MVDDLLLRGIHEILKGPDSLIADRIMGPVAGRQVHPVEDRGQRLEAVLGILDLQELSRKFLQEELRRDLPIPGIFIASE
jgi:hypothetical protein